MFNIVEHIRDEFTKEELKEQKENKGIQKCEDFHCIFAGTISCVAVTCAVCKLHNCRGCIHLDECIRE